jgi:hypothetical protein
MKELKSFRIDVGSGQEHEDLTAEIYYGDEFVGLLTQESGFDSLEFVFHPRDDGKPWSFQYEEFLRALSEARQRLWDLRKNSTEETKKEHFKHPDLWRSDKLIRVFSEKLLRSITNHTLRVSEHFFNGTRFLESTLTHFFVPLSVGKKTW